MKQLTPRLPISSVTFTFIALFDIPTTFKLKAH